MLLLSRLLQYIQQKASFITPALPMKNKRLLKHWVHVTRQTNLLLNCHTRTCKKHFVNAQERHLYSDEVPSLTLPSNNRSLGNNRRKPQEYWLASLGKEPVTVVVTIQFTQHNWASVHLSFPWGPCIGLSRVTNFPFSLRAGSSCSMP